jgi:hypothetical protein
VPDAEFPAARATISADAVKDGDTIIKVKRLKGGKGAAERLCGLDRHAMTAERTSRVAVSIKVGGSEQPIELAKIGRRRFEQRAGVRKKRLPQRAQYARATLRMRNTSILYGGVHA